MPDDAAILSALGEAGARWLDLREHLRSHYDFAAETVFFTKDCGWSVRYRRSGKTLCTLFPERGGFTVLLVLGRAEILKAEQLIGRLNENVLRVLQSTPQLHDGRWLWIPVTDAGDAESVKALLAVKAKPKRITEI